MIAFSLQSPCPLLSHPSSLTIPHCIFKHAPYSCAPCTCAVRVCERGDGMKHGYIMHMFHAYKEAPLSTQSTLMEFQALSQCVFGQI